MSPVWVLIDYNIHGDERQACHHRPHKINMEHLHNDHKYYIKFDCYKFWHHDLEIDIFTQDLDNVTIWRRSSASFTIGYDMFLDSLKEAPSKALFSSAIHPSYGLRKGSFQQVLLFNVNLPDSARVKAIIDG